MYISHVFSKAEALTHTKNKSSNNAKSYVQNILPFKIIHLIMEIFLNKHFLECLNGFIHKRVNHILL